jgi:CDP-diacylglycerol---serine O-phosphatidyltransferase
MAKRPDESRPGLFRPSRARLQRGVIILPSAFTLGSLFFGIYSIVASTRSDFFWAGWFIVISGILDMLDGRVARFTRTGSAFGAELDSLVDAISFGVAPGFIMYQLFFSQPGQNWSWTLTFVFVTACVVRLARFNVEQAGHAKTYFHGLPTPAAGLVLATYYPFSQTLFFQQQFAAWPWHQIMAITMVLLAVLMVSHVPYAVMPRVGLRSWKGGLTLLGLVSIIAATLKAPSLVVFPLMVGYAAWGLLRSVVMGLLERLPERDPLLDEDDAGDEADAEIRSMDYTDVAPSRAPLGTPDETGEDER